jgi:hypothetical protein
MSSRTNDIKCIKGPDGAPLTMNDLPKIGTTRWVVRRKAIVVSAVVGGLLTIEEACKRYHLTAEEFLSWQCLVSNYGLNGLRITQLKSYRR